MAIVCYLQFLFSGLFPRLALIGVHTNRRHFPEFQDGGTHHGWGEVV